jgi:hypothetical protein
VKKIVYFRNKKKKLIKKIKQVKNKRFGRKLDNPYRNIKIIFTLFQGRDIHVQKFRLELYFIQILTIFEK